MHAPETLELSDADQWIQKHDTSGDGFVSPQDVLLVINWLNNQPTSHEPALNSLDVNGDGQVSPSDALQIIQALNQPTLGVPTPTEFDVHVRAVDDLFRSMDDDEDSEEALLDDDWLELLTQ